MRSAARPSCRIPPGIAGPIPATAAPRRSRDRPHDGPHHVCLGREHGPEVRPQEKEAAAGDPYTLDTQFEVESYLRHQGQSFINRFDANSYLYITRALDEFDLSQAAGSLEAAFAPVEADSLVVGFTSDWLFPPEQNRQLALALLRAGKRASYAELSTDLGHDSFLLESEQLYTLVRGFLERDQIYTFDYAI
jgi:homoserine O-acetyltransferase